jgi:hypothetical protein
VTEVEYCLGIPDPAQRKAVISALSPAGLHCMGEGKDCAQFLEVERKWGLQRKKSYTWRMR